MNQRVGVIGLGIMGGAMANNLIKAGFEVIGYDIAPEAIERLIASGGRAAASVAAVVSAAPVSIVSIATVKALLAVYTEIAQAARTLDRASGANGDAAGGRIVIDTCTMPLDIKQQAFDSLAGTGCVMLDCPVSGTGAQAAKKDLVVLGSGDAAAFDKARAVLEGMSRKQVYLGAFGKGSTMKFIANHLVNIHNVAAAEAFTLASKAGLDLGVVYDTLQDSAATSRMFQMRGPLMVAGHYQPPTARIDLHLKDLDIISGFAEQLRCPVPLFMQATQLYHAAKSQGYGGDDTAAVCRVLESLAGVARADG